MAAGKWDGGVGQTAAVLAMAFAKKGDGGEGSATRNPFRVVTTPKLSPKQEAENARQTWEMFAAAMKSKFGEG